jgi:hypothetical protein
VNAEVKDLLADPVRIVVNGRDVELRPFKFGKLTRVVALAGPMIEQAKSGMPIEDIFTRNSERVVPLCAELTGLPPTEIEELEMDEAVDLLGAIFEVNTDFFAKAVLPRLHGALNRMAGRLGSKET